MRHIPCFDHGTIQEWMNIHPKKATQFLFEHSEFQGIPLTHSHV